MHPAGDGPKLLLLEEVRDQYRLFDRVFFAGPLQHSQVRNHLIKGHIFLNTSLTEAFCMAIVEAAACGLLVVSTKVGGVPEVLPPDLIRLAEPKVEDLVKVIDLAIQDCKNGNCTDPTDAHERIAKVYRWPDVARRTEIVYSHACSNAKLNVKQRFQRYFSTGPLSGPFWLFIATVHFFLLTIVNFFYPLSSIKMAP